VGLWSNVSIMSVMEILFSLRKLGVVDIVVVRVVINPIEVVCFIGRIVALERLICWFLVLSEGFIKVVVVAVLFIASLMNFIRVEVEVEVTMLRRSVAVVIIILGPRE